MSQWKRVYFVVLTILLLICVGIIIYLNTTCKLTYTDIEVRKFLLPYLVWTDMNLLQRENCSPEQVARELCSLISDKCEVTCQFADGTGTTWTREEFIQFIIEAQFSGKTYDLDITDLPSFDMPRDITMLDDLAIVTWQDAVLTKDSIEILKRKVTITDPEGNAKIIKIERTFRNASQTEIKEIRRLAAIQTYKPNFEY